VLETVRFFSEGERVEGLLARPAEDGPGPRPGIVLGHGFTAVKEMILPDVATRLAAAGFVALVIDYRYFGASGGTPRGRLLPLAQVADLRNALTWLGQRPGVDPERLGLFGTSFGGANVAYATALDERVRCAVSNVGVGDGERWLRGLRSPDDWAAFRRRLAADRVKRVLTGESERVHAHDIMVPDEATRRAREERQRHFPAWDLTVLLESADAIMDFRPEDVVHRIAPRPMLWIHAGRDVLVPPGESRRMAERAGAASRLVLLEGLGHYDTYVGAGFDAMVGHAVTWFRHHLHPGSRKETS
jgi:dienelactone hydrolase